MDPLLGNAHGPLLADDSDPDLPGVGHLLLDLLGDVLAQHEYLVVVDPSKPRPL